MPRKHRENVFCSLQEVAEAVRGESCALQALSSKWLPRGLLKGMRTRLRWESRGTPPNQPEGMGLSWL